MLFNQLVSLPTYSFQFRLLKARVIDGKNRENIDKKGKGWKNTMFEGRACDENTSVDITNTKNLAIGVKN